MHRKEFVKGLSSKMGTSQVKVDDFLTNFLEYVGEVLAENDELVFMGFGKFEKKFKAERSGVRNPATGAECVVPAHNVVKFKVGSKLADKVNE